MRPSESSPPRPSSSGVVLREERGVRRGLRHQVDEARARHHAQENQRPHGLTVHRYQSEARFQSREATALSWKGLGSWRRVQAHADGGLVLALLAAARPLSATGHPRTRDRARDDFLEAGEVLVGAAGREPVLAKQRGVGDLVGLRQLHRLLVEPVPARLRKLELDDEIEGHAAVHRFLEAGTEADVEFARRADIRPRPDFDFRANGVMPSACAGAATTNAWIASSNAPSARRQGALALFEKGIEEAIAIVVGHDPAAFGRAGLEIGNAGTRLPGEKRLHGGFVFFPENRAGCVKQFTTTLKDLPQAIEERRLLVGQLREIGRSTVPANVGMAAHDARSAAGRIEQDPLERTAVPPGIRGLPASAQTSVAPHAQPRPDFPGSGQAGPRRCRAPRDRYRRARGGAPSCPRARRRRPAPAGRPRRRGASPPTGRRHPGRSPPPRRSREPPRPGRGSIRTATSPRWTGLDSAPREGGRGIAPRSCAGD